MYRKDKVYATKFNIDRSMTKLSNQSGVGKLTLLVFGTIVFVLGYCAYNILPFYYYYYEVQNQFDSMVRVSQMYTDKQIRERLLYQINRMEIPVEPEALKIERSSSSITISMSYSEVFYITWQGKDYDIHTFYFSPSATGKLK